MTTGHWLIIAIILVLVLVFGGASKLPEFGAGLGRAIREFRNAASEGKSAANAPVTPAAPSAAPPQNPASSSTPASEPGSSGTVPPAGA